MSNSGEQHAIYTLLPTSKHLCLLSTFFPSKTRAQRHVASRLRMLVLLNHVPLARPIAKHLSKGFRVPFRRKRISNRLESGYISRHHQFQNFFADISQHAWSRFPSFKSGKRSENGRISTGRDVASCTLRVASIPFSPLSRCVSARNRATMLQTIAERPSEALSGNHTFFSHRVFTIHVTTFQK